MPTSGNAYEYGFVCCFAIRHLHPMKNANDNILVCAEPHLLRPVKITKHGSASIGSKRQAIAHTAVAVTLRMAYMSFASTAVRNQISYFRHTFALEILDSFPMPEQDLTNALFGRQPQRV